MSRLRYFRFAGVLLFASLIITQFQNCMPGAEFKSAQSSFSTVRLNLEPDDTVHVPPVIKVQKTSYEPILADRRYLSSVFVNVFGPAALSVDSTRVHLDALAHGGPCSVYVDHTTFESANNRWVRADAMEACSRTSPSRVNASVIPKATVTRQALLTRACSDLTTNNTTLDFALKKLAPQSGLPTADRASMLKAFRLFYRDGAAPHNGLLESLQVMIPTASATKDHWRVVLNTICASSLWQVL